MTRLDITGVNLTGTDGDTNRTYTLPTADIQLDTLEIYKNGLFIHKTYEYTIDGAVITFLINIYDSEVLSINYTGQITESSGTLLYTTPLGFSKHIMAVKSIPNKKNNSLELVGTGDDSSTSFWLDINGVIQDTYTLYYGADADNVTALTEDTHYTIDLSTSEITLTSAGVALISTNNIYAKYKYNDYGLINDEVLNALKAAEQKITRETEVIFANSSDTNPGYKHIINEQREAGYNLKNKVFDTFWQPIVKIQTTVNGDYTTGGTEITLIDATLLPNAGNIYIGGNKVSYTSKTTNTLTIPASTPSIADGATVRGEVIEVSREAEGNQPSWTVLVPEQQYEMDYLQGFIKPLDDAWWTELANSVSTKDGYYPENYKIRFTYFHAFYTKGSNPEIPRDIVECTYMIAAKKFTQRVIKKAYINGKNDFNPTILNSGDTEVNSILEHYKTLNVGSSPYNKQFIS